VPYKERFKVEMVKRMRAPESLSAGQLALETGIPQPTLSRWLRTAPTIDVMPAKKKPTDRGRKRKLRRRTSAPRSRERTAEEKLQIVLEAAAVPADALGAFLREKGVFEIELMEWRQQALAGIEATPLTQTRPATPAEVRRIHELERDLRRKEKALAEAAALIVLKKKVQAIWGDEDDDTDPTNES
jgi:hypothetical protein